MNSNELTAFVLSYFFDLGIFACRHGVAAGTAQYTDKNGNSKSRYFRAGIPGGHDIFVWLPATSFRGPLFLGVEIKTGKDRLRPEQVGFHANIVRMGHLSIVVHDKDDFLNKIKPILHGIPKEA